MVHAAVLLRLEEAKSRLSPFFSLEKRKTLVYFMFMHVLSVLEDMPVTVLTSSYAPPDATKDRAGNINSSISAFLDMVDDDIVILPSDLPFLCKQDVAALIGDGASPAIAPSHNGGTSGIFLPRDRTFVPQFGPGSFKAHLRDSMRRGVEPRIVEAIGFRDLDTIDDVTWIQAHHPGTNIASLLAALT